MCERGRESAASHTCRTSSWGQRVKFGSRALPGHCPATTNLITWYGFAFHNNLASFGCCVRESAPAIESVRESNACMHAGGKGGSSS